MGLHYYDADEYRCEGEYEDFIQAVADLGLEHDVAVKAIVFEDGYAVE